MNTSIGKCVLAALAFLLLASAVRAHTVSLAWKVSIDDIATNCTVAGSCQQTVYRAPGACSATSSFISLGTLAASQSTYTDATVPGGTWCYAVTFTLDGIESAKDTVTVSLLPATPTGLTVTGKS